MRALLFTPGSPFARGVRIILHEIGLDYEMRETPSAPAVEDRGAEVPTLQVPTLWDGGKVLWESGLIAEYLMSGYEARSPGTPPLSSQFARRSMEWEDRLTFATVQTLGTAVTTISQMTWTGVTHRDNEHLARCAQRVPLVLRWLEARLTGDSSGFFGEDEMSASDVFLACHLGFVANRPLGLDPKLDRFPMIAALVRRVEDRSSAQANPILWWDPDVTGYADDGKTPIYGA